MRPRKKKHLPERLSAVAELLAERRDDEVLELSKIFTNKAAPLDVEIGCGKGSFAIGHALAYPDRNYLAVEKLTDIIITALEKAAVFRSENLRFLIADANMLAEILPKNSVETLYINFCDPWPKTRHAKRRLTNRTFLKSYMTFLKPDGKIAFKTDNRELFDFSLVEFEESGFKLENVTYDLHASKYVEGNIITEYEKNFSEKGFPIHRLVARLTK